MRVYGGSRKFVSVAWPPGTGKTRDSGARAMVGVVKSIKVSPSFNNYSLRTVHRASKEQPRCMEDVKSKINDNNYPSLARCVGFPSH